MIKTVTVVNHLGESLKMELTRPQTSGFYIEKIEGLGPSVANVNVTERASIDGGYFSSAHVNTRNIVLTLGFWFDSGVEDMRHKSYRYFPLKKKITLIVETDKRICEAYGYVESNEPDIFSERETAQISILCPDPYFYANIDNTTTLSTVDPLFEFEFSNESLVDPLIEFGNVLDEPGGTVHNSGDVDVGVTMTVCISGDVNNLSITNKTTGEVMNINSTTLVSLTGSDLHDTDEIIISTIRGSKSIRLLRDGSYTNIVNCLDRFTDWIQLVAGDNQFVIDADTGADLVSITVENKIAYAGV